MSFLFLSKRSSTLANKSNGADGFSCIEVNQSSGKDNFAINSDKISETQTLTCILKKLLHREK